jgi:hypothetical protein
MTTTTTTDTAPAATPDRTAATPGRTADWVQRHARAAGFFYLLTFAASMPALLLIGPAIDDPAGYITGGGGQDTQVLLGCFLDFVNALAGIGTAVAVFPIMKRVRTSFALGFVLTRMVEAAVILTGVVSLMAVVTLRQDLAGGDAAGLATTGQALVAVRDWTFLLGPGFMAVFNALLFGTLLYKSRLVPRIIPTLGLVGAPLLFTANTLTFFGLNTQLSVWSGLATLPIATWELSVGVYMLTKGFRPSPVTAR